MINAGLKIDGNTVTFWLRVKPRSARERLTDGPEGELCLEIHAAPSEGQANEAAIGFLARALRLPKGSVSIVTGEKSRRKLLRIVTAAPSEVADRLRNLAAGQS